MPRTNPILKTIFIFAVFVALVSCGAGEEDNNDTVDAGSDATHAMDAGGEDALADSNGDATETDADADTGDSCDAQQVAAEQVAVNDSVNAGDVTVATQDGVDTLTIDASSGGIAEAAQHSFVYLDLDTPEKLALSDVEAFEDDTWDIAVRRTSIRINGGDSGPGNWLLTTIDNGWADATQPGRDAEWNTDDFVTESCELEQTQRGSIITAFGQWYDYDPQTHVVSAPENTTWALYNTSTHNVVKLGIASYDSGTYDIRIGQFEN